MPAPKKFKDPLAPKNSASTDTQTVGGRLGGALLPPNPKAAKLPVSTLPTPMLGDSQGIPNVAGSTLPELQTRKYNKDYLKDRWTTLSGRMMDWLNEGDRLETLLAETRLRDLGVMLGIATEKVLLLEGQPTQIIGQPQHQALDRLGLALKDALEKRGLVTLTERKVDIKLDGSGTPKQTS